MTDRTPDLAAEVLGFRGWRVAPSGLLMSAAADDGWVPGENVATCPREMHPAPQTGCGCGLYAHYELGQVPASVSFDRNNGGILVGAVAGWGRVILHPDGWRAEFAKVIALFRRGPADALERCERLYGAPVLNDPHELPALDAEEVPVHMRPAEEEAPEVAGLTTFAVGGSIGAPMAVATAMPPPGSTHHYTGGGGPGGPSSGIVPPPCTCSGGKVNPNCFIHGGP